MTLRSCKMYNIHVISKHVAAIARYSASADERATLVCFFDFQEINESPKKIQYPEIERRVTVRHAQSESQ